MLLISILLPVLGAVALFIWRPRDVRACHALTMTATLATSACVAWCIFTPGAHPITLLKLSDLLSISFKLDGLGRVFGGLVAFLWPLSTLYAFEYMAHEGGENHFFGFYLLSYAVTLGIAFAEDLMTLYIFYELLTLATLFLVMHGMKPQAVYAGRKYVYYSLGGAAMAFLALATVMYFSGNSNFVAGGIPVSALLHAVAVVKAGAFAVIRLSHYCFSPDLMRGTWAQTVCLIVAMFSIVFGSAMAVRERHMKRRLAYSTMSNLSYVLLGALMLTPEGLQGGLLHMVYHAIMKICLFSCVGAMMIRTGKSYVGEMRGMSRVMPFTMAVFLFCGIELVGIPPFVGFQSKWALATAALSANGALGVAAVVVLIVSAVLTSIYMLAPAVSAYAMPLSPDSGLEGKRLDPGWRMQLPLILLVIVMLILVFASAPLADYLGQVAAGLV